MERTAVITGASQGLGLALARRLGSRRVGTRHRCPPARPPRRRGRRVPRRHPRRGDRRRHHRSRPPPAARHRGPPARVGPARRQQCQHARREPAAGARHASTPRCCDGRSTSTSWPRSPSCNCSPTRSEPGATIVNITSDAAAEAYPTWGGYGASKAALEHAGRVLAVEHPEWRVLTIDPGDMRTEMHQDAFPDEDIGDRPEPEASVPGLLALIDGEHPSGRYIAKQVAPPTAATIVTAATIERGRPHRRHRELATRRAHPSSSPSRLPLDFELDDAHIASAPAEARGLARDEVRLMVSRGDDEPVHASVPRPRRSPRRRRPARGQHVGHVPAAVDAVLSGRDADRRPRVDPAPRWAVDGRAAPAAAGRCDVAARPAARCRPSPDSSTAPRWRCSVRPPGPSGCGWRRSTSDVDLLTVLVAVGRPIRYSYVDRDWPIDSYQTVFADQPGSAEMPSAARPFTADLTTRLIRRGIGIATITLHTGVSSLEGHELPYAERFAVPPATAAAVNADPGGRRPRDRRRHHRRAGARVGGRRDRHGASGSRVDRRRDHPGDGRPRRRRPGVGLARAGRHPPGDARGGRRARRADPGVPGGVGCRLPVARVRRQPPAASVRWRSMTVDDDRDAGDGGSAAGRRLGAATTARRASGGAVRGAPDR